MSEPKLFWYEHKELDNPIAIIGFPSIGLVGSIITSFIARELKLKVIAGMTLVDTQQYTLIQEGESYPPIRIYAGSIPKPKRKKKAKPAEGEVADKVSEDVEAPAPKKRVKARDIVIVTSEIAPKPEQTYEFTNAVFDVLKELGVTEIIFVDGIPRTEQESVILGAYSNEAAKNIVNEAGISRMDNGLIRGISGVGLYMSAYEDLTTICLISPANPQIPDPRAAADLLEPLKKLVPRFDVDPSPLFKEAEEIESRIRAQQTQQMTNQNLYG